jgi:hypothetical protein
VKPTHVPATATINPAQIQFENCQHQTSTDYFQHNCPFPDGLNKSIPGTGNDMFLQYGWEEQESPLVEDCEHTPQEQEQIVKVDNNRKRRRTECERRYRNKTDQAFTEMVDSFQTWHPEILHPSKRTKEAQLKHAAKLIKLGINFACIFALLTE